MYGQISIMRLLVLEWWADRLKADHLADTKAEDGPPLEVTCAAHGSLQRAMHFKSSLDFMEGVVSNKVNR